jgi:hypothetical protein
MWAGMQPALPLLRMRAFWWGIPVKGTIMPTDRNARLASCEFSTESREKPEPRVRAGRQSALAGSDDGESVQLWMGHS